LEDGGMVTLGNFIWVIQSGPLYSERRLV
jgi:hypothetical protein